MDFPRELLPEFSPLRPLGRGGMGVVWHARQKKLDRDVALKLMLPGTGTEPRWRARFVEEGRLAARIRHPNIVQVLDAGSFGEHGLWIACELVAGETLAEVLKHGALELAPALAVLAGVLAGLQAIHDANVLHRDLKPGNVMLGRDGVPRILDFGLARPEVRAEAFTETGVALGTCGYMGPEILLGRPASRATDIYAAGALGYALITGGPVFAGTDAMTVLGLHLRADVPDPRTRVPGLPEHVAHALLAALEKDPHDRPQSAEAFARMLLKKLPGKARAVDPPTRPVVPPPPPAAATPRTPWPAVIAVGAALGVVVAVGWRVRPAPVAFAPSVAAAADSGPASSLAGASAALASRRAGRTPLEAARTETLALLAALLRSGSDAAPARRLVDLWLAHADSAPGLARAHLALALATDVRLPLLEQARLHALAGERRAAREAYRAVLAAPHASALTAAEAGEARAAASALEAADPGPERAHAFSTALAACRKTASRAAGVTALVAALPEARIVPGRPGRWNALAPVLLETLERAPALAKPLHGWLIAQQSENAAEPLYWVLRARLARTSEPARDLADDCQVRALAAVCSFPDTQRVRCAVLKAVRNGVLVLQGSASHQERWRGLDQIPLAAIEGELPNAGFELGDMRGSVRALRGLKSGLEGDRAIALAGAAVAARGRGGDAVTTFELGLLEADFRLLAGEAVDGARAALLRQLAAAGERRKALEERAFSALPETILAVMP